MTPTISNAEALAAFGEPMTNGVHPNAPGAGDEPPPIGEDLFSPVERPRSVGPLEIAPWEAAEPMELARVFEAAHPNHHFARHRSDSYRYDAGSYLVIPPDELAVLVRQLLRRIFIVGEDKDGKPTRKRLRTSVKLTHEVVKALEARPGVMISHDLEAPLRRSTGESEPDSLITSNGILNLATRELAEFNADVFATSRVDYEFDPTARPEKWNAFLEQLWPEDPETPLALMELLGLMLTGDTRYQKIFLLVGPKRSGKGTVLRTLSRLIGRAACVSPSLASMAGPFGLQSWMGKRAALIADARLSGRTDQAAVAELFLRISGEDGVEINRKHKPSLADVRLPTRIVMATNELPRFNDASGALASRFIIFRFTESFYGRENHRLEAILADELPGILNASLDGLDRLRRRGHILQPETGRAAIEQLEEMTAPVATFVGDELDVDPRNVELQIKCSVAYDMFARWCTDRGWKSPPVAETFGRDLSAAFPSVTRKRKRAGTERAWVYVGMGLPK